MNNLSRHSYSRLFAIGLASLAVSTRAAAGQTAKGGHMVEKATFAAGCFWGVEAAFRNLEGVTETQVGYTGGSTQHPTYEQVCSHTTGHAEAVEVSYDPAKISYQTLLKTFWEMHDPTQKNRQGWDIGDNYRSAIFYHTPKQKAEAEASLKAEQASHKKPIATEIAPAVTFWRAEEYHQRYLEKTGRVSCHIQRS